MNGSDPTVTDWRQTIVKNGKVSDVRGGNCQQNSPWALYPLSEITDDYRIPDFAPEGGSGTAIYTAVALGEYVAENPNGPCDGDWSIGDDLGDLGLTIVNGQISGVSGLYFATCPFELDPDSDTGWVPVEGAAGWLNSDSFINTHGGALTVISEHAYTTIPVE